MTQKTTFPLLFCGSSHQRLGEEVALNLGSPLGKISLSQFPDGEIAVEILEDVRGRDAFVLQSIALNSSFYLMQLLIMVDALKRSYAKSITAIIPYFGYCRQDRKDKPGVPITAKLVANLLMVAGISRLITFDLHAGQLEGFFEIPVDHLHCQSLLAEAIKENFGQNWCVVAPDIGSAKLAKKMAKLFDCKFVIIEKQRISDFAVQMRLIGHLSSKNVLLVDDICSTAGTITAAAKLCQQEGAEKIVAATTHGVCADDALLKIEKSPLTSLVVTNTIPSLDRYSESPKVWVVSIARLIAEAIKQS